MMEMFNFLRPYLLRLYYIGAREISDQELRKRVVLTNQITGLTFFLALNIFLIFLLSGNYFLCLSLSSLLLSLIGVFVLNSFGRYYLSRVLCIVSLWGNIIFHASVLGPQSCIHFGFFFMVGVVFLSFGNKERWSLLFFLGLLPVSMYLLEFFEYSFFIQITLPSELLKFISLMAILDTFLGVFLSLYFLMCQYVLKKNRLSHLCSIYSISEREVEILEKLIEGKTNRAIATELFIEEGTVKNHLNHIYRKTSVKNRMEMMSLLG